jgi:hypothetical protein
MLCQRLGKCFKSFVAIQQSKALSLSPIGKVFWISAIFMLMSLGSFWAAKMYYAWQNIQVE